MILKSGLLVAASAGLALAAAVLVAPQRVTGGREGGPGRGPDPPRGMAAPAAGHPGRTIAVRAGEDLQAALDEAQPGDSIELEAGAAFRGPFLLPRKQGDSWIVIRSNAPEDRLPPPGRRITPADASLLPKLLSPGEEPAVRAAPGAHHYRFVGVEFTLVPGVTRAWNLVILGEVAQSSPEQIPHHLILERVYVHGAPGADVRRGVALNGAETTVIDSWISEIHEVGAESQALAGSTGPGPFRIVNNYIEGAGENILFGGADPAIPDLVPSDIEIRGNHIAKPLSWMKGHPAWTGVEWTVKNLLELKNARRVVIDGNLLERNWPAAQSGFAILFTVRNQDCNAPWSVVEDVAFTNNVVRGVASAINILGHDDHCESRQTSRILIRNNLFDDVGVPPWGGHGRFLQLLDGTADVVVEHNTVIQKGEIVAAAGRPHTGFIYRYNASPHNEYGIGGDSLFGDPLGAIARYLPGAVITGNIIAGGDPAKYPEGNLFPAVLDKQGLKTGPGSAGGHAGGRALKKLPDGARPGADPRDLRPALRAGRPSGGEASRSDGH